MASGSHWARCEPEPGENDGENARLSDLTTTPRSGVEIPGILGPSATSNVSCVRFQQNPKKEFTGWLHVSICSQSQTKAGTTYHSAFVNSSSGTVVEAPRPANPRLRVGVVVDEIDVGHQRHDVVGVQIILP